jgi:hypothetical protein
MARPGCRALVSTISTLLVAAALVALPLHLGRPATWHDGKSAWARKDGGNDGGSDRGGKPDHAGKPDRDAEVGRGSGKAKGHEQASGASEPKGQGRGLERVIERLAGQDRGSARSRYEQASGRKGPHRADADRVEVEIVVELTPAQTGALMRQGWARREPLDSGWRNHGERVRTMVAIAKALGHPASVGALQANFGTPYENGLEPAPAGDWTVVGLDINGDGRVDRLDLAALGAPAPADVEGDGDEDAEGPS